MRDVRGIYNAVVVLADAGRLDLAQEVFDLADEQRVPVEIEKLKAENERLKAAAQAVVDAESAINNAIIALSADAWNEIVEQRKRTLVQAIYALRQQIREQTK